MSKSLDEAIRSAHQPPAMQLIAEAVSKLTAPPLVPLYQTFLDVQTSVQEQRTQLHRDRNDVRVEGFAAATRLALSLSEEPPRRREYFDQPARKE